MYYPIKFWRILPHVMHNKDDLIAGHCEVYLLCWSVLKFIVTKKVINEANKAIINNKNNKDRKSIYQLNWFLKGLGRSRTGLESQRLQSMVWFKRKQLFANARNGLNRKSWMVEWKGIPPTCLQHHHSSAQNSAVKNSLVKFPSVRDKMSLDIRQTYCQCLCSYN